MCERVPSMLKFDSILVFHHALVDLFGSNIFDFFNAVEVGKDHVIISADKSARRQHHENGLVTGTVLVVCTITSRSCC